MASVVRSAERTWRALAACSIAVVLALAAVLHAPRVEAQDAIGQMRSPASIRRCGPSTASP